LNSLLTIDAKYVAKSIEADIQRLADTNSAKGVIIGLSGGIDSAVLATLAVQALGTEKVHVFYLYDRDSEKKSRQRAKLAADWLGIELTLHDITPEMRKNGLYSSVIMRLTALSGFINCCLNTCLHRLFFRELPFLSTLRRASPRSSKIGNLFYECTTGKVEAAFNARHIYRRKFLEQQAKERNCLVLGAANRSECLVGWFVKDGIDDMPFSPLNHLYKTQIQQLASYLHLPPGIQNQQPSPDMVKGVTDETAIGITYADLDIILHGLDNNLSDEQIIAAGATADQISHVRTMNKLSTWKRLKSIKM